MFFHVCVINIKILYYSELDVINKCLVRLAIRTNINITGTSTNTPTTVTKVAHECSPKSEIATATANSKKLLAPIMPAGEAISCGIFNDLAQK
jgi:hypothetical protein